MQILEHQNQRGDGAHRLDGLGHLAEHALTRRAADVLWQGGALDFGDQ
jgi:hypothetical protein